MKNLNLVTRSTRNPTRTMLFLAAAMFSMAFTLPGCPNMDELNEKISGLEKRSDAQQKAITELTNQLRTMNDEHNTMKQLVSQISTTVLEQKDAVEKLQSSMASRASAKAPAARSSSKPAGKRHR